MAALNGFSFAVGIVDEDGWDGVDELGFASAIGDVHDVVEQIGQPMLGEAGVDVAGVAR